MGFDYEAYLNTEFNRIIDDLKESGKIESNIKIAISDEQAFLKSQLKSRTLYLVFKRLNGELTYGVTTQPYQLLLLSEENQLENAKLICDVFAESNNFTVFNDGTTYVKHTYQKPVVLSNFNEVQVGYRSVIYISAQLLILDNLLMLLSGTNGQLNKITIDSEVIDVIGFKINYTMTPDTQALPTAELAQSKKSTAGLSIAFSVALKNSSFNTKVLNIMKGSGTGYVTGNTSFAVSFKIGTIDFSYSMKLISCQFMDDPEQAPGISVGLMV